MLLLSNKISGFEDANWQKYYVLLTLPTFFLYIFYLIFGNQKYFFSEIMSFQHKFLRSYMIMKFDYIKRDW